MRRVLREVREIAIAEQVEITKRKKLRLPEQI